MDKDYFHKLKEEIRFYHIDDITLNKIQTQVNNDLREVYPSCRVRCDIGNNNKIKITVLFDDSVDMMHFRLTYKNV